MLGRPLQHDDDDDGDGDLQLIRFANIFHTLGFKLFSNK